jgi:hypothetical protein
MNSDIHNQEDEVQNISNLPLLNCFPTTIYFGSKTFEVSYCLNAINITLDKKNNAVLTLKNQQVPYKATILGGYTLSVKKTGKFEYHQYFDITWPDEHTTPAIVFFKKPTKVIRKYEKGEKIELGIEEEVYRYHVEYQDGVTADFTRNAPGIYDFKFSTGFSGTFKKEADGTHTIRFKGLPQEKDEDNYRSESKFIITRSRYTNNLVLILQDKAIVSLQH